MKPPQYAIVMRAVEAYAVTRATLSCGPHDAIPNGSTTHGARSSGRSIS